MAYSELLMTPIYDIMGCDAELNCVLGSRYTIRAIDRTRGIPVTQNGVEAGTLAPAAAVKATDLSDANVTLEDLPGGMITMNGKEWRITAVSPLAGPEGELSGQVIMILSEYADA